MPKIKKSCVWKFFIKSNDTDSGDATCKICNREVKSCGKGGGTTNLKNHLKRNHAGNKEVKLTLGESENSNEKAPNPEQANNLNQLKLSLMPSPASTSTFTSMDLSESNLTPASSPAPSLSESDSRFYYTDRQYVFQPRIDNAFKQIKSFEGNIYRREVQEQEKSPMPSFSCLPKTICLSRQ
ncbi:uncharacterized protein LOC115245690 isoform X2 [Formica exsecta]|uniref:uncharacterized protein LOC115245690 isoform X2 n=1 Tax=Formica exsecta TaxID=72781 RepID=UPI001141CCEA|nr:uncharacterized protein LOC115245690 isoform X2 [Formica exsecta]